MAQESPNFQICIFERCGKCVFQGLPPSGAEVSQFTQELRCTKGVNDVSSCDCAKVVTNLASQKAVQRRIGILPPESSSEE